MQQTEKLKKHQAAIEHEKALFDFDEDINQLDEVEDRYVMNEDSIKANKARPPPTNQDNDYSDNINQPRKLISHFQKISKEQINDYQDTNNSLENLKGDE